MIDSLRTYIGKGTRIQKHIAGGVGVLTMLLSLMSISSSAQSQLPDVNNERKRIMIPQGYECSSPLRKALHKP
ncbi:MAG: hypothetical protein JWL77_4978 [Chthonomonadaceae bacterium]|nr:hypothetical protein [Chthonomonadaceae bacterium]